jgi:alkylation response protein AidB-like acyl-CoA dehydrogenase
MVSGVLRISEDLEPALVGVDVRESGANAVIAARELSRSFAESALVRDAVGRDPVEELAALRAAGLLRLAQQQRLSSGSVTWRRVLEIVRIIARGDCSIAHLLGYHYVIGETIWLLGTAEQAAALASAAVDEDWYWAAIDNPVDPDLVLRAAADGFVVSGRKTFATGARLADHVIVTGKLNGVAVTAAVPGDRAGLVANDDWDNIGQRATASGSAELHDLPVAVDEILGKFPPRDQPPTAQAGLVAPFTQLVLVNVLLGAAEGALADALEYTRAITRPWQSSGVATAVEDPYILELCGQLTAELRASVALAEQAAVDLQGAVDEGSELTHESRGEAAVAIYAAKTHSTRVALEVTSRVFELMGARATARRYGFDRRWRDVRTLTLHDPVAYKAREVGEYVLTGAVPSISPYS